MTKKCKSKKRRYLNAGGILLVLFLVVLGAGCISEEPEKPAAQAEKLDKIVVASPFSPLAMPMAYIVENDMLPVES